MISQIVSFNVTLVGDGASTSASVDFADLIKLAGVLPKTPTGIYSVSAQYGATGVLSGSTVDFTFTTALPTSPTVYTVVLEF